MSNDNDKIIAKIKKLLKMADEDGGATEQERETALRQATKLMDMHALSVDEVNADQLSDPRGEERFDTGTRLWKVMAFDAIGRLYGCVVYRSKRYVDGKMVVSAVVIGKESARVTVAALAGWVISSIEREARTRVAAGRGRRENFKKGAAVGIHEVVSRLIAARKRGETTSPGQALVVVDAYKNELQANREWMSDQGVRLSKGRSMTISNSGAFGQGRAYGSSINLDRQVGGKTVRRLR